MLAMEGMQIERATEGKQAKQVVFITGTSSGFGLLTSVALATQGYQVIATMRDLGFTV